MQTFAACRQRLGHVAGILDAAVRDDRDAILLRHLVAVHDRRDLRHADTGHHTGGADGAGADTDLYGVHAGLDQSLRRRAGRHIARDHRELRERALDGADGVQDVLRVAVRGVHDDAVHLGGNQRCHTVHHIRGDADRCAAQKTPLGVLGGVRVFDLLFDVLDGDQALEVEIVVHDGQLLLAGLAQDPLRLFQRDADLRRDQVLLGHGLGDLAVEVCLELQVAVGDDADQLSGLP